MNNKLRLTIFSVFLVMGVSLVKCTRVLLDNTKIEIAFDAPEDDPEVGLPWPPEPDEDK